MLQIAKSVLHRARVTLQTTSPLMVGSGQAEGALQNTVVRDENNWPIIPGTSIAGVIRSLAEKSGSELLDAFGEAGDNNEISQLTFSTALVHDSQNGVCEARKVAQTDTLLKLIARNNVVLRDGVGISVKGVAENKKLFHRNVMPAGLRFTFECSLWAEEEKTQQWLDFLALFTHPLCTLGGGSRNGYGQFELVDVNSVTLDLANSEQALQFRQLPRRLSVPWDKADNPLDIAALAQRAKTLLPVTEYEMTLTPENGWRIGGGSQSLVAESSAKLLPYTECVINWNNHVAEIVKQVPVLPSTSLKGAFAHRMEFHYRRLIGVWAEDQTQEALEKAYRSTAVKELLGYNKDKEVSGKRGGLWFSDIYINANPKVEARSRNSINRFTGGTLNGALFAEERLFNDTLEITMCVDESVLETCDEETKAHINKAIELTLRDLKQGRLAVGAGQNNGAGYLVEA